MPLIDADDPHAKPPRIPVVAPGAAWTGPLDVDRGWAELDGVELRGQAIDLSGCDELSITDGVLSGVGLGAGERPVVEIRSSTFDGCDLSQARITSIHRSRLDGCKLAGTDLSAAVLTDVVFERCSLRYVNLRMARLTRVGFVDCTFDEVDAYQLEAQDVAFDRSRLSALNVDRLTAIRVDLRGAVELDLRGVGRLDGCLVAHHQLPALAPLLALAVGLDLERPPGD